MPPVKNAQKYESMIRESKLKQTQNPYNNQNISQNISQNLQNNNYPPSLHNAPSYTFENNRGPSRTDEEHQKLFHQYSSVTGHPPPPPDSKGWVNSSNNQVPNNLR